MEKVKTTNDELGKKGVYKTSNQNISHVMTERPKTYQLKDWVLGTVENELMLR